MTTLREISRSNAFSRIRSFDESARFHVWHSRLGLSETVDRSVQEAMGAGRCSLATMRELISVCAAAVSKARDERHDRVEGDDIGYAISQR